MSSSLIIKRKGADGCVTVILITPLCAVAGRLKSGIQQLLCTLLESFLRDTRQQGVSFLSFLIFCR